MERMKIEIEKSEYDRLKSREEKLLAYYDWFVDKENDLVTVEDIINENIELHNTLEDVYKEKKKLGMEKVRLIGLSKHKTEVITGLGKNLDELKEENKKLKEKIKRLEFDVDAWHQLKLLLEGEIERLRGLQICGKTVAERIEDDKKVVRE